MNTRRFHFFYNRLPLAGVLIAALLLTSMVSAQEGLPPLTPYTQNFDTLASTPEGGTTSTGIPNGWAFNETGTGADTNYRIEDGTANNGDTYSFGTVAASDRAFGGLNSGSVTPVIGAYFQNNTGGTIGQLQISFYCEMWRQGTAGRADRMDFQYSTNATSLTDGTWTDFDSLDCVGVDTGGTGAINGNTQRTLVNGTITGLNIVNGSTFWLRWGTFDASGADDGLAIDDFVMNEFTTNAVALSGLSVTSPFAALAVGLVAAVGLVVLRKRK